MGDREKLIEICRRYDGTPPCDTCKTPIGSCSMCGLERLIDYLISHGVTVRERGRWNRITAGYYECSNCMSHVAVFSGHKNFCPNCGADMRTKEDGEEDG